MPDFSELPEDMSDEVRSKIDSFILEMIAHGIAEHDVEFPADATITLPSGKNIAYSEFLELLPLYLPSRPHGADAVMPALDELRRERVAILDATYTHNNHIDEWAATIGSVATEKIELGELSPSSNEYMREQEITTWFGAALELNHYILTEDGWPEKRIEQLEAALVSRGMNLPKGFFNEDPTAETKTETPDDQT